MTVRSEMRQIVSELVEARDEGTAIVLLLLGVGLAVTALVFLIVWIGTVIA